MQVRFSCRAIWCDGCKKAGKLLRYGALSLCLITCSAQNLSLGFVGGGALTNAFETINAGVPETTTSYSQSKDYVAGLMLEYWLGRDLSVEGDAIYRELHLTVAFVEPSRILNSVSPSPVVTWELPLMAKYRLHWSKVNPFIEGGLAFRPTTNLNANPSHYGVVAGVGISKSWRQFQIAPMVRYTRWVHDRPLENLAESERDQLELMIGVNSQPRSAWHPLSSRIALGLVGGTTLLHDVSTSSYRFVASPIAAPTGGDINQQESATAYVSGSDASLLGPALEIALLKDIFVETDAVYHPIECSRRSVLSNGEVVDSFSGAEGRTWEFPVLGKYKLALGRTTPFLEAGPSFRLLTENSSIFGMSAGAGVEVRLRALKVAPALRFTHWGPQGYHSPSTGIVVNQVELLTGLLL